MTASGHAIPRQLKIDSRRYTWLGMRPHERRIHEDVQSDPSDEERAWVEPLLPPPSERGRPRNRGLAGSIRQDVRDEYGLPVYILFPPVFTVRSYFFKWRDRKFFGNVFRGLLHRLSGHCEKPGAIDSQSFKTAEDRGHDADKKIEGRKQHMIVDVERPSVQRIHEASVQDRDGAVPLIRELAERFPTVTRVWADGGHAGPKLEARLSETGLGGLPKIVGKPSDIDGFNMNVRSSSGQSACCRLEAPVVIASEMSKARRHGWHSLRVGPWKTRKGTNLPQRHESCLYRMKSRALRALDPDPPEARVRHQRESTPSRCRRGSPQGASCPVSFRAISVQSFSAAMCSGVRPCASRPFGSCVLALWTASSGFPRHAARCSGPP